MQFLDLLVEKMDITNNPCRKHLKQALAELTKDEVEGLNKIVEMFLKQGISLEDQCFAYKQMLDMTIEESKFFMEHGKYRYSTFDEVADKVYFDKAYMKNYMIGLALSQYLWKIHKSCYEYFVDGLAKLDAYDNYLEIGPGHGAYFYQSLKSEKFKKCTAVDLSETSIAMTKSFVESNVYSGGTSVEYVLRDVNDIEGENVYDFIVMCEVLEHVENPEKILTSLRRLLKPGGRAYFSIPINAPEIDHIKLFCSPEEVKELLENAGFVIKEQKLFCSNANKIERALKYKEPILMCVWLA